MLEPIYPHEISQTIVIAIDDNTAIWASPSHVTEMEATSPEIEVIDRKSRSFVRIDWLQCFF